MLTNRQEAILRFINAYREENGFPPTVREIGRHFGIYPATVQDHIEALRRKGFLQKKPFQSRSLTPARAEGARSGSESIAVPVLGRVAAGLPIAAQENIEDMIHLPKDWAPAGAFLLRVRGNSMEGAHILDGDYVLVHPQPAAANGDIVVALIGEDATVKRFYRTREGITLKAENPLFEPIEIPADDASARIIGRVVGVIRVMRQARRST